MEEVRLHGFWPSSYAHRVIWALKLKGIQYEHMEEDLSNKSQLLLQYNPIHKKVPVLVHNGKPVVESVLILEYIEETWPQIPLLPKDAVERAVSRFWIKFGEEKRPRIFGFFGTDEDKHKAVEETQYVLTTLEEHCIGDNMFLSGDTLGMVDLAFGWIGHWLAAIEEVTGEIVLEAGRFPRLHA
ncbi:hypothetical protein K2173_003746 [Erythroxylum novogranatense]|uniref:Glutathione S-transferase n=1 Tax=Erythroxylum novogranatense TaxID=1862640 RepID=A0AAV8TD82_9ROSI|nr:hypothetical protein K2173_003746 [Erythroxylum novogranatense]